MNNGHEEKSTIIFHWKIGSFIEERMFRLMTFVFKIWHRRHGSKQQRTICVYRDFTSGQWHFPLVRVTWNKGSEYYCIKIHLVRVINDRYLTNLSLYHKWHDAIFGSTISLDWRYRGRAKMIGCQRLRILPSPFL